jgi:ornithine carbamoyltransferase
MSGGTSTATARHPRALRTTDSRRLGCRTKVAAHDQGAHVTYLDPTGAQLGHKESIRDTGRVLDRMYDGIQYRSFGHAGLEELHAAAGVPVWNGLTDQWHPAQALCDMFTMREHTENRMGRLHSPTVVTPATTWATRSWWLEPHGYGRPHAGADVPAEPR